MPERRTLTLASLADVSPEVDRLLSGYEKAGGWSLGQICYHLTTALTLTVEGAPVRVSWLLRRIVGPIAKRHVFRVGRIPVGLRVPVGRLTPPAEADDRAEAEALRAAIRHFQGELGPFVPHPLFGPMSVDEWRRFHTIHCAHHLSFLVPRPSVAERSLERADHAITLASTRAQH